MAIPFLLALFVTLALLWQIQRLVRTSQWVEHTDQVIAQTNQLIREIVDLQTALRGYVITNDPSFLNPYRETRGQIIQSVAQLQAWTKENPSQTARFARIERLASQLHAWNLNVIREKERGGSAERLVASGQGETLLHQIRGEVATILAEENWLKKNQLHAAEQSSRIMTVVAVSGFLLAVLAIAFDIRKRRHFQGQLSLWHDVSENAGWGIVVGSAAEEKLLLMNKYFAQMHGYPAAELIGRPIRDVFAPQARDELAGHIRLAHERGYHTFESLHLRKDGSIFPVLIDISAIKDAAGRVLYRAVNVQDITERKKLEAHQAFIAKTGQILAQSLDYHSNLRQFAALLVPELADWCVLCMPDSQGHLRMEAGAHFDPQKQSTLQELAVCHVPQAMSAGILNRVFQNGKAEIRSQVGDEFVCELSADPAVRNLFHKLGMTSIATLPIEAHGRVLGTIAFVYGEPGRQFQKEDMPFYEEVARRAALSIDKARLYREAQDAIRVREEVISVLSHDLRDPLNTIVLNTTLLDRLQSGAAVPDPTLAKLTDGIIRSAKLMQRLILGLLDLAKLQAGTFAIHRRSCTISSLFVELGEIVRPLAQQKALTMKWAEDSTPIKLYCDRDRILQVLANVVSNAIKFTPSGGFIEITAKRQNELALFAIKDTGPGLAHEQLIHMFDRNWQARETAALGAGLGLWIAKSVVVAHGGNIWAQSVLGQGVTVFFTIPTTETEREYPASN